MRWCKRFDELDTYLQVDDYVSRYLPCLLLVFYFKKIFCCINLGFELQNKNKKKISDSSVFLETLRGCCGPRK